MTTLDAADVMCDNWATIDTGCRGLFQGYRRPLFCNVSPLGECDHIAEERFLC